VLSIALVFGVRILAEDHDRHVRFFREGAVDRERGPPSGGLHGVLDSAPDRCAAGKIAVAVAVALPGEGPATALFADVVRAVAGGHTRASLFSYCEFQASVTMDRSRPAFNDCGHLLFVQPATCPCRFQSPTRSPSNFMRSFSTSVSSAWLPCIFWPCQLL